ncbi:hypothetical protein BDZ89DRAFT_1145231 [Hymenopellis radicata]|nr:hypothetical protein BDZ89DRAFT_1145231 [Hymenopellis radicata]
MSTRLRFERVNVPVKLALNGVGENVQEHIHVGPSFQLKDDVPDCTYRVLRDPESYAKHLELFTKNEGVCMISETTFAYLPLSTVSPRADELLEAHSGCCSVQILHGYSVL